MLAIVTMAAMSGPRPVSPTRGEPARMPRGQPAVQQVSANKQSGRGGGAGAEKNTAALTIAPHPSIIPKNTHTELQDSTITLSIFHPYSLLSSKSFRAA